jgi:predicted nucleic acid-binding Zn ribbon protein
MKSKDPSAGIREEILREWRGCDEAVNSNAGITLAEKWIRNVMKSIGAGDGLDEELVRSTWQELAGDFIASHTEPQSVRNGHLVLRVTQPAMRFHLEQMKPMLLTRIREQLGEQRIKSVKFTLG